MAAKPRQPEISLAMADDKLAGADAIAVFRESVMPALHDEEGYEGCYVLLSEEGKLLVLSFWTSNETARATRLSGFYQEQIEKLSDLVVARGADEDVERQRHSPQAINSDRRVDDRRWS